VAPALPHCRETDDTPSARGSQEHECTGLHLGAKPARR